MINNKSEKNEHKQDYYSFLNLLKQYLPKSVKKGNKSGYELEIRSCEYNPTNTKIDIFSFDQKSYFKLFDFTNIYINQALILITLEFKAKDVKYIESIKIICNKFIYKILKSVPNEKKNNYKFYFRNIYNTVYIDFYLLNEKMIKAFLDVGIDINEYDRFNISLNSSFIITKLLSIYEFNQIFYDIFSLVFYVKTSRTNIDYLFECFQNVLKNHKFNDNELMKEIINGIMSLYNISSAFKKFKLDLDAKILVDEYFRVSQKEDLDEAFESLFSLKKKFKEMGKDISQELLTKGLLYFSQIINIDNFSFYLGIPQYKNGIAFIFNIEGLTKFVSIFFFIISFNYIG